MMRYKKADTWKWKTVSRDPNDTGKPGRRFGGHTWGNRPHDTSRQVPGHEKIDFCEEPVKRTRAKRCKPMHTFIKHTLANQPTVTPAKGPKGQWRPIVNANGDTPDCGPLRGNEVRPQNPYPENAAEQDRSHGKALDFESKMQFSAEVEFYARLKKSGR